MATELPLSYRALGGIKDALCELMLRDEEIRTLVMPELDDERFGDYENWIGGKYFARLGGKKEEVILHGHCFTVPFVKDTITDDRLIICMETYVNTAYSRTIKDIKLMVNIFSTKGRITELNDHDREVVDTLRAKGYTGNFVDMATAAVCHLLDTTDELIDSRTGTRYGIGKMALVAREPIIPSTPNTKFYGRQIFYDIPEFNVTSVTPQRRPLDQA